MGRNAGFAAAVNRGISRGQPPAGRDSQLRRRTGSRLPGKARRRQRPFRHGQDSQSIRPARWDLRPDLSRRHHVALRRRPRRMLRPSTSRATSPRRRGPPCFTAPKFSARSACSRNPSNPISKMRISGCAAPPSASPAATFPMPGRSTWGAPHWAAGIRKRCAAFRAINSFSRPAIIPLATYGRSWSPSFSGARVAIRHGRGLAWARGKLQGLRHFSAARMQNLQRDPELLEQILRSNEQFIQC